MTSNSRSSAFVRDAGHHEVDALHDLITFPVLPILCSRKSSLFSYFRCGRLCLIRQLPTFEDRIGPQVGRQDPLDKFLQLEALNISDYTIREDFGNTQAQSLNSREINVLVFREPHLQAVHFIIENSAILGDGLAKAK
jgi:hypothetical protein